MEPVVIFDNADASLKYHPDAKIVHHTFKHPMKGEPFRNVLLQGYEVMKKYGANKWLSDDRLHADALTEEDAGWATTVWSKMVMEAGWKYWALVVSSDLKSRMDMNAFIQLYYEQGVTIMVFTNPDEALTWLKSKN